MIVFSGKEASFGYYKAFWQNWFSCKQCWRSVSQSSWKYQPQGMECRCRNKLDGDILMLPREYVYHFLSLDWIVVHVRDWCLKIFHLHGAFINNKLTTFSTLCQWFCENLRIEPRLMAGRLYQLSHWGTKIVILFLIQSDPFIVALIGTAWFNLLGFGFRRELHNEFRSDA